MIYIKLMLFSVLTSLAQQPANPAGPKPGVAAQKAPEINLEQEYDVIKKNLEPFIYNGFDLRDPFRMPQSSVPLVPGGLYGPFLPLQYFQLSDLRLKGILWKVTDPRVLITTPEGVLHKLGLQDYLGENFGYIAVIREKEVVVVQTIMQGKDRISETKILTLNQ